ncbi:MAG TPA: hypothetical protein ACHBZ9_21160 [Arsenophonus nasoniae]|uniref:hypothetical protein n=1 Tax=Arsenophonus nasoniae TaxID=638 RepID=UPI003879032D
MKSANVYDLWRVHQEIATLMTFFAPIILILLAVYGLFLGKSFRQRLFVMFFTTLMVMAHEVTLCWHG